MNASMPFVHIGFAALTLIYFFIFISMLQKGIVRSALLQDRKKKLSTRIVIVFVLWIAFVSAWSRSSSATWPPGKRSAAQP